MQVKQALKQRPPGRSKVKQLLKGWFYRAHFSFDKQPIGQQSAGFFQKGSNHVFFQGALQYMFRKQLFHHRLNRLRGLLLRHL